MTLTRTNSDHPDFVALVRLLDADLARRDGEEHAFYAAFNRVDTIKYVVLAYEDGLPAGCGALKEHGDGTMEIKRMFVPEAKRRKGIASRILHHLELWAGEFAASRCILETGRKQPDAIALYRRSGYTMIPNYGQYVGVENSVCFEKKL
jgi:GNAT superfamily N-acetyltransferase